MAQNSCIMNFRDPKTPFLKLFMYGSFLYFEGQRGPIHKQFGGSGARWGGQSAWEVSVEILYVYAFWGGGLKNVGRQLHA